jgi:hypothetical protein
VLLKNLIHTRKGRVKLQTFKRDRPDEARNLLRSTGIGTHGLCVLIMFLKVATWLHKLVILVKKLSKFGKIWIKKLKKSTQVQKV